MRKYNVCLIEDDPAFMYLNKIIIKKIDETIDVISFEDGAKAFSFFEQNKADTALLPDLIFLDLNMPIMDGWGFLDAYAGIKDQIGKNIPIYILSSSISDSDISRANANPLVYKFLSKPFEERKFAEILSAL